MLRVCVLNPTEAVFGNDADPESGCFWISLESLIVDQIRSVAGDARIQADVDTQATINLTQEINELESQSRQVEKQMKRDHGELGRLKKSDSRSDVAIPDDDAGTFKQIDQDPDDAETENSEEHLSKSKPTLLNRVKN